MTTNKTDKNAANLPSKPLHQYFNGYLLAIFFIVVAVLSSALWFSAQQAKLSQALISEQLVPLQKQLIQQSYLSKANKTIDEILQSKEWVGLNRSLQEAIESGDTSKVNNSCVSICSIEQRREEWQK